MGMCSLLQMAYCGGTGCHMLRPLCAEIQIGESEGQLWPTVSEELRSMRVSLEADPPSVEPSDRTTAMVMF